MARLALIHGSPAPAGDYQYPDELVRHERMLLDAMLVLAHHAGSRSRSGGVPRTGAPHGGVEHDVTALELELAANILANRKPFVASTFDRSERRWIELPAEDPGPHAVDLSAEFEAATGVVFADLRMVGVALWARTAAGGAPHIGRDHLADLEFGEDRTRAVLDLISADLTSLRAEAAATDDSEYDTSLFGRHPLVECLDGSFIIMNEAMLVDRTLGWLPRWDLEGLRSSGGPTGKKRAAAAVNYLREVTERHALETFSAVAATSDDMTLYINDQIQSAYGTGDENADAALIWGTGAIVAEISSRTVMRGTAAGSSVKDFLRDLELGVVDKASQLDATIAKIRDNPTALTGDGRDADNRTADDNVDYPTSASFRFWPVLVTTEGWPVTPRLNRRHANMLEVKELLQEPDVAPLNIIDIEGLEALESVLARTRLTLEDLLRAHQLSALSHHGFRDWLLETFSPVRPTDRIMSRWDRVMQPALQRVSEDIVDRSE